MGLTTRAKQKSRAEGSFCLNCDNRHECTTARSEVGVWHCEEYT